MLGAVLCELGPLQPPYPLRSASDLSDSWVFPSHFTQGTGQQPAELGAKKAYPVRITAKEALPFHPAARVPLLASESFRFQYSTLF